MRDRNGVELKIGQWVEYKPIWPPIRRIGVIRYVGAHFVWVRFSKYGKSYIKNARVNRKYLVVLTKKEVVIELLKR
jgi:hypothetical protein